MGGWDLTTISANGAMTSRHHQVVTAGLAGRIKEHCPTAVEMGITRPRLTVWRRPMSLAEAVQTAGITKCDRYDRGLHVVTGASRVRNLHFPDGRFVSSRR